MQPRSEGDETLPSCDRWEILAEPQGDQQQILNTDSATRLERGLEKRVASRMPSTQNCKRAIMPSVFANVVSQHNSDGRAHPVCVRPTAWSTTQQNRAHACRCAILRKNLDRLARQHALAPVRSALLLRRTPTLRSPVAAYHTPSVARDSCHQKRLQNRLCNTDASSTACRIHPDYL